MRHSPSARWLATPARWPVALVVGAFAAALYAVTLGGTYVYDDFALLAFDDRLAGPSQWLRYLTEGYNGGVDNLYRPVTSITLAVQAWLLGTSENVAWAYHLVNVVLFAVVCGQVAVLASRLRAEDATRPRGRLVALAAGLLFAAHPVHVEAVAGVAGRAELICAAGFLGGLLVLCKPLTRWRVAAFVACLFLSVGGKEQGLLLPGVAAVWFAARRWAGRSMGTNGLGRPLFAAVALPLSAYLVWREHILPMAWNREKLDPTIQPMILASGVDLWLMPLAILGRYAALLVWPRTLSLDYGTAVIAPPQSPGDPYLWLGVAAVILFLVAAVHAIRTRWVAGLVTLAGLALTYGVVSNFLSIIGTVFGERLIFLPSAFFVTYVVLLGDRLLVGRRPARWLVPAVVAGLVVLGSLRTLAYAARWNDRLGLYAQQVAAQPKSVRLWMLYGDLLRQEGRLPEAAEAARRATELAPDYWDSWGLRSEVALLRGDVDRAVEWAERGVEIRHTPRSVARRDAALAARWPDPPAATTRPATSP